ncbi:MAG TPA: valine--tRNA ligase [Acholeplasmataceae bacterium]|nr:valine--tRNA ligase [Acholeplasmataceae bacterium]
MSKLPTKYNFKEVEKDRYQTWLEKELFNANRPWLKPFTIVIPPPNVTGRLHLGHAWDNTLQDIIIRRKRMQGYDALYLPGMDHAGIATQARIEAKLKESGISRYDLGREKFLEKAWEWKEDYSKQIRKQWEALGISVDYSKERFTLDEGLNKAVNHVFISMYHKGLIYRGNRIINWDVKAKTALSNIEVIHKEELAKLYYLKYPLVEDENKFLTIATTRPETMFADQALMIHPDDRRHYKHINKEFYIPGTNKKIRLIADGYVDMEFGTGVVKVTPAHDINDFEVGLRHDLEMPLCMEEDGTMNEMAFEFNGMDRFECRKQVVDKLNKLGLVEKIEDYETSIGYSERTGVVVEPRLSLQWFLKMDQLSFTTLKETKVDFIPKRFEKIFKHWMTDTRDWTISRQLWWGHRIPAWYKGDEVSVQETSPGEGWIQDEDVLDTWFSSALWPFSTLGWPEETEDFKRFYPNDVLVTGYDIIFFWVARMIFQGRYFTKKDPFKDVLLHGLIRDNKGAKMSKSANNGVDPMDVIDKYGVDALRYFLTTNSAPGADLRYDEEKVESSWNFINKLWNITRFALLNITDFNLEVDYHNLDLFDEWIISRLSETIEVADNYFEKYEFNEASHVLYSFIWNDFAAWYLELAKVSLQDEKKNANTQAVLLYVLKQILKLLHPFVPFVTDKLYSEISEEEITRATWPSETFYKQEVIDNFNIIADIITKIRNLRAEYNVTQAKLLNISLVTSNKELLKVLKTYQVYLENFLKTNELIITEKYESNLESVMIVLSDLEIFVAKEGLIDLKQELELLNKQKEQLEKELLRSEKMLANKNFLERAKPEKIAEEKAKYEDYKNQYNTILASLEDHVL